MCLCVSVCECMRVSVSVGGWCRWVVRRVVAVTWFRTTDSSQAREPTTTHQVEAGSQQWVAFCRLGAEGPGWCGGGGEGGGGGGGVEDSK